MTVCDDDVFAHVAEQFGKFFHTCHDACFRIQHDVRAVVVLYNAWAHVLARSIRARVHVSDEANGGNSFVRVGRKCGINIAQFVHFHLSHPDGFQFLHEIFGQSKLLFGARGGASAVIALRVEAHIFEKTVYNIRHFVVIL